MKIKKILLLGAFVCVGQQANATTFFNRSAQIGCGTITSVRNLNQAPLYTQEYELSTANRTNTSNEASSAYSAGLLGLAVATVVSTAVDAALVANLEPTKVQAPSDGVWKRVVAVRIALDDGRELNLPLMNAERFERGQHYETGQRLHLTFHKELNNIQPSPAVIRSPKPGEKNYDFYCGLRADKNEADVIVKASEHLVDETKIVE